MRLAFQKPSTEAGIISGGNCVFVNLLYVQIVMVGASSQPSIVIKLSDLNFLIDTRAPKSMINCSILRDGHALILLIEVI